MRAIKKIEKKRRKTRSGKHNALNAESKRLQCIRLDCTEFGRYVFSFFFFFWYVNSKIIFYSVREKKNTVYILFTYCSRSHDTIHIFKNYFTIVFSVSTKISSIQTNTLFPFLIFAIVIINYSSSNINLSLHYLCQLANAVFD